MDLDDLSCPICNQQFDETERIPLMFPQCGHTYCQPCVEQLFTLGEVGCPECSTPLGVDAASALPKNFALIRMIKKRAAMCQEHNKELEYICMDCRIKVCANWALFGSHKGHSVRPEADVMKEITLRAECLIDMFQIVETSQVTLDDEKIEFLTLLFQEKKMLIVEELEKGFEAAKAKLEAAREATLADLNAKFQIVEDNFTSIKEIPVNLAAKSDSWKSKARVQIEELSKQALPLDILTGDNEIFSIGEQIVYGFEKLKDIPLGDLQLQITDMALQFNDEGISKYCKVHPNIRKIDLMNSGKIDEDKFAAELENCKLGMRADFTGVGDISFRGADIAKLLIDNTTLRTLVISGWSLNDNDATEIFRALQENMTLVLLDISSNNLGSDSYADLVEMLGINTTVKELNLAGNKMITEETEAALQEMSSRFRKILVK